MKNVENWGGKATKQRNKKYKGEVINLQSN